MHGRLQTGCGGAGDRAGLQGVGGGRSLGINDNLLRRWRQEFADEAAGSRLLADEREELKRLRKENRLLRMEKEILKKPASTSRRK